MIMIKTKCKKASYSASEVCKVHNIYRGAMVLMVVIFLWVLHKYGVSDEVIRDVTGGQVRVKAGQSYWAMMLMIGKWLSSAFAVVFALMMAWDRLFKKKYERFRARRR